MAQDPNMNWSNYIKAVEAVKAHPMCGKFEDNGWAFIVLYPEGDFPVAGVAANYRSGKIAALKRLLTAMEKHWSESYPGAMRA